MRNYVKESAFQMKKKISLMNFFSPLLGGIYFLGYSALIFMHSQKYYETFMLFSIPFAIAISFLTLSSLSLPSDVKALLNEIEDVKQFLENSGENTGSRSVNALVELYRLQKGDKKWESINDMLREAFPEKSELRKAVTGIMEGGREGSYEI